MIALMVAVAVAGAPSAPDLPLPPAERGMALGLFSADPEFRYRALVDEIVDVGATHITVVWVWWQSTIDAHDIKLKDGWSATEDQVLDTLRYAKQRGLHVTAFPIVRLERSEESEWRGRIAPKDLDAWWRAYERYIRISAGWASKTHADRLSIGSELLSRERERDRWRGLIERLRLEHPSLELLYSGNWDHFHVVSFWDLVDVVGLTGYWELTEDPDASVQDLALSWANIIPSVHEFSEKLGRSLLITEIGYPSLRCGACKPWNETRKVDVDIDGQLRAYEAFIHATAQMPELQGIVWWNWFGFGGPEDGNYTPRGKPAASLVKRWFGQSGPRGRPPVWIPPLR